MNIKIKTLVDGHYKAVMAQFDLKLFEALKPPIGEMEIVEFTGSKRGDRVHIRFKSPLKAEWISEITEDFEDEKHSYFVDEGKVLPPGLTYWRHKHIVEKVTENSSYIIDDITFKGPNILVSALLYPGIFMGFYPRKRIYKKYFREVV